MSRSEQLEKLKEQGGLPESEKKFADALLTELENKRVNIKEFVDNFLLLNAHIATMYKIKGSFFSFKKQPVGLFATFDPQALPDIFIQILASPSVENINVLLQVDLVNVYKSEDKKTEQQKKFLSGLFALLFKKAIELDTDFAFQEIFKITVLRQLFACPPFFPDYLYRLVRDKKRPKSRYAQALQMLSDDIKIRVENVVSGKSSDDNVVYRVFRERAKIKNLNPIVIDWFKYITQLYFHEFTLDNILNDLVKTTIVPELNEKNCALYFPLHTMTAEEQHNTFLYAEQHDMTLPFSKDYLIQTLKSTETAETAKRAEFAAEELAERNTLLALATQKQQTIQRQVISANGVLAAQHSVKKIEATLSDEDAEDPILFGVNADVPPRSEELVEIFNSKENITPNDIDNTPPPRASSLLFKLRPNPNLMHELAMPLGSWHKTCEAKFKSLPKSAKTVNTQLLDLIKELMKDYAGTGWSARFTQINRHHVPVAKKILKDIEENGKTQNSQIILERQIATLNEEKLNCKKKGHFAQYINFILACDAENGENSKPVDPIANHI